MTYKTASKKYTVQNGSKDAKEEDNEDYVAKSIGAFGLWQFLFVLIAASTRLITTWSTSTVVFLTPDTNFVCTKFSQNATANVQNNTCYDDCVQYNYTMSVFEETMISEFGLICKKEWLASLTQSIIMFGILCGVSIFGWFSDRFGRGKAMILSGVTCSAFMFATPFCPSYLTNTITRFLSGLGAGGYLTLTGVYVSELVGTRLIDTVICTSLLPFDGFGLPIMALFAYLSTSWRTFMIICSSVSILIVSITFFLPETPRWLVAKGKNTEAIDLLTRAAKMNRLDASNISDNVTNISEKLNLKEKEVNLTYLHLFSTKKLAIWTIASVCMWFTTGFSYFGLVQYISQFGTNAYITVSVLGIAQVIAAPLSVAVVKFCGRKTSSIGIYTTIGVLSLALIFTAKESTAAVVLGTLGVTAASISFSVVYILVIELYPTTMRNMGLSVSSIGSKIAAIVAPFVVNIKTRWIASLIFALVAFAAVLFTCIVPETKGKKLKDCIDDDYK